MNWATTEPEQRLYKGKALFKWGASPGLDHHCGVCAKHLHHTRAKTTCIGKHVEPCYRFHQQLHFVGKSHECFGCTHSDEKHHARHKEILKIIRKLAEIDEEVATHLIEKSMLQTPGGEVQQSAGQGLATSSIEGSEIQAATPKLRRSERKKAKKIGGPSASKKLKDMEAFRQEETDFISEAIHLTVYKSKGAWEGSYVYGECLPKIEEDEAEPKERDAENVAGSTAVLSLKPAELTSKQKRLAKRSALFKNSTEYRGYRKSSATKAADIDLYEGLDPQILFRLGVKDLDPPTNSATRKELVGKLIEEIKNDLSTMAQEDAETRIRQIGFWRWAGKPAYHSMTENRKKLDWATGMKRANHQEYSNDEELPPHLCDEAKEAQDDDVFGGNNTGEDIQHNDTFAFQNQITCAIKKPQADIQDCDGLILSTTEIEEVAVQKPRLTIKIRRVTAGDEEDPRYGYDEHALATLAAFELRT